MFMDQRSNCLGLDGVIVIRNIILVFSVGLVFDPSLITDTSAHRMLCIMIQITPLSGEIYPRPILLFDAFPGLPRHGVVPLSHLRCERSLGLC